MDETTQYRIATLEDALTICELGQVLNAVHHAARPDIYTASTEDFARDLPHWMNYLDKPGQVVFIAHVGQQAAGFIAASLSASSSPLMQPMNIVRIGSVCVAEGFWGKGIGRQLMQLAKDWALEHDAQEMRLSVWSFNERAARMYVEFGFESRTIDMGMRLSPV
ncbi:GNAT family N-acetyltransferase [Pseudomonas syringae]|jgi:ribosomal protein S18 acetylase RimI-like enzyme